MSGGLLAGRVAVVTGAGRGIGKEIALMMAAQGGSIVVNDVGVGLYGQETEDRPAHEVVNEITRAGGKAVANFDSVSEWASASNIVGEAIKHFGRIDIVVNNAGILRDGMVFKMSPEDFDVVVKVHLYGSFYVSRAAADHFKKQENGCYIHMTSTSGIIGNMGQANYAAAKMGIVGLSTSLALDMRRYNVRSNCIAPAASTRMTQSVSVAADKKEERAKRLAAMPPEAIASVAIMLASDAAGDITGQVWGCRGGEVYLYSQHRPVRTIHHEGGFTPEQLIAMLPSLKGSLHPTGDKPLGYDPF
jgi:NAD(P)-dependent dehydrogenase (short-subunit alcohol dehydrogenase family)